MPGPPPPPAGRLLGLDVGTVRLGVAVSDPTRTFAQPLTVLPRWARRGGAAIGVRLADVARAHGATAVVVGRPLSLAGEEGPAVCAVEALVADLADDLRLPILWWDERLSTREAERALIAAGMRRAARREEVDRVAAALILQSYLDAEGRRAAPGRDAGLPPADEDRLRDSPAARV